MFIHIKKSYKELNEQSTKKSLIEDTEKLNNPRVEPYST